MRSRYGGTCPKCHKAIKKGASIVREGDRYVHMTCPRNWFDQISGLDDKTEVGGVVMVMAAVALLAHQSEAEHITLDLGEASRIFSIATERLKSLDRERHGTDAADESLRESMEQIKAKIFEARAEAVRARDAADAARSKR